MKQKFLLVEGDTNDADYITEKTSITDSELEELRPVFDALKAKRKENKWSHNWDTSECGDTRPREMYVETGILTQDQVDFFGEFVPYGEYGIHTITSVEVIYEGEKLY